MARKPHPTPETRSDAQLREALDILFYDTSFIDDVINIRRNYKIPDAGFDDIMKADEYVDFDEERQKDIKSEAEKLTVKYQVPPVYWQWIESFIMMGYHHDRFVPTDWDVNATYGVAWDFFRTSPEYIAIRIYPGATKNGVQESIEDYWCVVEKMMKHKIAKGAFKFPPVRSRPYYQHEEIYQLFKKGEIDSTGTWLPGIEGHERPECLKDMNTDQIKHIVATEKRKEKLRARTLPK